MICGKSVSGETGLSGRPSSESSILPVAVARPQRMNAHARQVKRAVENVAAHDIALVEQHLGAQIAGSARVRTYRDQRIGTRKRYGGMIAVRDLHHGEGTVGAHLVAGSIDDRFAKFGPGQQVHGLHQPASDRSRTSIFTPSSRSGSMW